MVASVMDGVDTLQGEAMPSMCSLKVKLVGALHSKARGCLVTEVERRWAKGKGARVLNAS